jgi:hypothetical protein
MQFRFGCYRTLETLMRRPLVYVSSCVRTHGPAWGRAFLAGAGGLTRAREKNACGVWGRLPVHLGLREVIIEVPDPAILRRPGASCGPLRTKSRSKSCPRPLKGNSAAAAGARE